MVYKNLSFCPILGQPDTATTRSPVPHTPVHKSTKLHLGEIYHKGLYGVERNLKEAMKWYKAAEQQEIPGASQGVKTVKGLQHAKCVLL